MTIHRLRPAQQLPVIPSLLDRLIDESPGSRGSDSAALPEIKANIRRDLEWLLNTRVMLPAGVRHYPELERSLLNYGLPDFSTVLLGSPEHRDRFRLTVQFAIERLEPRLQQIEVQLSPVGRDHERTLYMKIAAVLLVEPEPVPLLFDSRVNPSDRTVKLRELANG
jgi:type VI secretion system protein ImpF